MYQLLLVIVFLLKYCSAFKFVKSPSPLRLNGLALNLQSSKISDVVLLSEDKSKSSKSGLDRLSELIEESKKDQKKKGPPIYEPGSYPTHILASLAYVIPIVDASDVGKYMFEAYPAVGDLYNSVYGPIAAIYNGVPFLPFVLYFVMSYVCRAPTFPVEVRFHFAQAFMLSIIQFIPVVLLGLLEKGGVPGLAVFYNTSKHDKQMLLNIPFKYYMNDLI